MKQTMITAIAVTIHLATMAQDTVKVPTLPRTISPVTQKDSASEFNPPGQPLTFSAYVEAYYSYDFNKPANNSRPPFIYNFNRHNEFNLNLGFVKAAYATERTRANLAIAAGTYMNANYAAEPGVLKNVLEANAGYKLSGKTNLWFDIGILPSHIGFESAIGKDNWTLTRSLVAENTPYFESGARLTYTTKDGKLQVAALALNGWQRITRVENNSLMSWGTQLTFKPPGKVTINYSTFVGTDKPDSARLWRYHNNLYGIIQLSPKVGLIASIDYGLEQRMPESSTLNQWYSPVLILRIAPGKDWAIAIRGEILKDRHGVIIPTGTPNGFDVAGGSVNVDYSPKPNIVFRLEGRMLDSKDEIFEQGSAQRTNNAAITFSTAISF